MPLDVQTRIDILRIAAGLFPRDTGGPLDDSVVNAAQKFAAFVAEGEVVQTPKPARASKPKPEAPVVADPETPAANETVAEAPKVEQKPAVAQTPPTPAGASEADVKAAVGQLATNAAAGGAPKAREILNSCGGATNISTLKPEFYAKAVKEIRAVLKTAEEAAAIAA